MTMIQEIVTNYFIDSLTDPKAKDELLRQILGYLKDAELRENTYLVDVTSKLTRVNGLVYFRPTLEITYDEWAFQKDSTYQRKEIVMSKELEHYKLQITAKIDDDEVPTILTEMFNELTEKDYLDE